MERLKQQLFTPYEIVSICGGALLRGSGSALQQKVTGVSIDTRTLRNGDLFIALPGERSDGHRFLETAAGNGAAALLIEKGKVPAVSLETFSLPIIEVDYSLQALQNLAKSWVARHRSMTRIAVTGSNGKSTTKEMIASILSEMAPTVKTPGNRNSDIGLPLSVFGINNTHEFGVFEMGINRVGEMDELVNVFPPEYSIMTNVGAAHVGRLGSIESIAREKSKIFHTEVRRGYIHEENIWKGFLRGLRGMEFCEFGREGTNGFEGAEYLGLQGWRITYEKQRFRLKHIGIHNLFNALGAMTVARDLGADPLAIARGLESLEPLSGRSRVMNGRVTVIEDSYNANTDSVSKILDYFGQLKWDGRKVVAMGSMKELGDRTESAHRRIGYEMGRSGSSAAFLFGKEMESTYTTLKSMGLVETLKYTESYEDLAEEVSSYVKDGDLLLVKGSRSMGMERLLNPLGIAS